MEMNIEENLEIIFSMEQELLRIKTEENMLASGDLGKKHGYGIYYWTDGDVYKGHWVKGKRHGEGIKIKNGIEEKVVFFYGKKNKN